MSLAGPALLLMAHSLPPLTESQQRFFREGIRLFNEEKFFECHEALEQAWLAASGGQKLFLQGLIQVAVAMHHLRRNNLEGAGRLLSAGIQKLTPFAPAHESIEIGRLLSDLQPLCDQIASRRVACDWQPPRIH